MADDIEKKIRQADQVLRECAKRQINPVRVVSDPRGVDCRRAEASQLLGRLQ